MKTQIQLLCLLLFALPGFLGATHIVGGEITYRCLGTQGGLNRYEITLNVYRSCSPGSFIFDNTVSIAVYDAGNLVRVDTLEIILGATDTLATTTFDTCFAPPGSICYEHTAYVKEILLPPNAAGYYLAWQRCCRNGTILNIVAPLSTGQTYVTNIPNTALCNSSPVFDEQPPTFICLNDTFIFDHGATDPDGDSLVYELTPPYEGGGQGNPVPDPAAPPYTPVQWAIGFSLANILGGLPPMNINPQTGLLQAIPGQPGQFVFSVSVFEYRNGVLLSEVKRDYQLNVMACPRNNPPQIVRPTGSNVVGDTLIFVTGQDNCFPITILDINTGTGVDSVRVIGQGDIFGGGALPGPYATLADSGLSPLVAQLCWHPLCYQAGTVAKILLPAQDDWDCPEPNRVFDTLYAKVVPPSPEPPDVRCVSVDGPSSISVSWINPPATKLEGFLAYELYRNSGNGWMLVASVGDSLQQNFTDLTVSFTDSISYCYRLQTAKDCPTYLSGLPGSEACSIIMDVMKINQVQGAASWNHYTVWANPEYTVFADSGNGLYALDSLVTENEYLHTQCAFTGRFRVRTIDPLTGCEVWSGRSPVLDLQDLVPAPIVLCRVTVEESDDAILLEWQAILEDDLVEVVISRQRNDENTWTVLQSGPSTMQTSYLDQGLDCDSYSYCYRIEVLDICGNEVASGTSCTIQLVADNEPFVSDLEWTPYKGWGQDLRSYQIFLGRHFAGAEHLVAITDTATSNYFDQDITEDIPEYCYRIRAHEAAGGCGRTSLSNEVCLVFPPRLYFPNAFSPNGDQLNDQYIYPNIFLDEFHFQVYDRWGMLIFETQDQNEYWKGKFRGLPCSEGAYVFVASGRGYDGAKLRKSGSITLIR